MGPAAMQTGCEAETSGSGQSQGEGSLEAGEWVPCAEPDWSEAEEAGSCRGVAVRQGDGCTQAGAKRAVQQAILWQEGLPVPKAATSTCCLKQAHAAQRLHSSTLTSGSCSLREGMTFSTMQVELEPCLLVLLDQQSNPETQKKKKRIVFTGGSPNQCQCCSSCMPAKVT